MREFGFGAPTGVELPGESAGLVRPTSRWSAISLASLSFGQEVGVTALQMAMATAAVANGGYLMKPLVVRRIEDKDGRVVKEAKPLAVRRVLQPETVDTLTEILKGVVREGTGKRAVVPGYVVAGKTGTAQKVDASGRYSMIDHVASFVGFVPASPPRARDPGLPRHPEGASTTRAATWPRPSSPGWPSRRCAISPCPPTIPAGCSTRSPLRPEGVVRAAYRPGAGGEASSAAAGHTPAAGRRTATPGSCPTSGGSRPARRPSPRRAAA